MLTIEQRLEYLATQKLLASLTPEAMQNVARRMGERELAAGEVLFREGDLGDAIFFIVQGEVEIYKGDEAQPTVLATLEPPDVFGDMAVLGDGVRTTSARARSPLVLLFLKEKAIKIIIQNSPDVAFGFFRILTNRLKRMNDYVAALDNQQQQVRARLTVVEGPEQGKSVAMVGNRLEIGRRGGSPLEEVSRMSLDDPSSKLSRHHAEVLLLDGTFYLRDLGSRNGTFLNGERIQDAIDLQSGDQIKVGVATLAFECAAT